MLYAENNPMYTILKHHFFTIPHKAYERPSSLESIRFTCPPHSYTLHEPIFDVINVPRRHQYTLFWLDNTTTLLASLPSVLLFYSMNQAGDGNDGSLVIAELSRVVFCRLKGHFMSEDSCF